MSDEKPQKQGMALKWRLLIWGGVLTLLLVCSGVAGAGYLVWQRFGPVGPMLRPPTTTAADERTIPPPAKATASLPLDPWSVPAVPVDHVIGVFPFANETGELTTRSRDIQSAFQNSYRLRMPRNGAITAAYNLNAMLERIAPNGAFNKRFPASEHDAAMFYNCSHTIAGTFTEADGQLVVDVFLRQYQADRSTIDQTKRFTVPAGHDYILAAQIYTWAHQVGSIPWDAATAAEIGSPLMGPDLPGTTVEPLLTMGKDPRDPRWKSVPPAGRFFHAVAAEAAGARDMADEFDTGPLPVTAGMAERMTRVIAHTLRHDTPSKAHELELIMAIYPGQFYTQVIWTEVAGGNEYRPERFIASLINWQQRIPTFSYPMGIVGSQSIEAAWNWRGDGYANTVSPEGWKHFHAYLAEAEKFLLGSLKNDAMDPFFASRLVILYGANDRDSEMHRIHRITVERYPDQLVTWTALLNYTRPRWGGSDEAAAALIDQAMTSRPDTPGMGKLAIDYWAEEARINHTDQQGYHLAPLVKSNEVARRQLDEGIARLSNPASSWNNRQYALSALVYMDAWERSCALLREDPSLQRGINDRLTASSNQQLAVREMGYQLWAIGAFPEMVHLAEFLLSVDGEPGADHRSLDGSRYTYFVANLRDFGFVIHGIAEHQKGNLERCRHYLDQVAESPTEAGKVFAYRHANNLLTGDVQKQLDHLVAKHIVDDHLRYAQVLLHHQAGRTEEAAALWKTIRSGKHAKPDWYAEWIAKETGYTL